MSGFPEARGDGAGGWGEVVYVGLDVVGGSLGGAV